MKVLIVDDEKLFLASLVEHLKVSLPDVDVVTASDGVEALRIIRSTSLDLVVTDVRMPELDGLELLAAVVSTGLDIPVVLMSAFGTARLEAQARSAGAFAILYKPIDLDELHGVLRDAARGAEQGRLRGISAAGFLQLLQMERKTCKVVLRSGRRVGELHFDEGELTDARWSDGQGEEAVIEMVGWPAPEIRLERAQRPPSRTVETSLTHLLMESARRRDEESQGAASGGAGATEEEIQATWWN